MANCMGNKKNRETGTKKTRDQTSWLRNGIIGGLLVATGLLSLPYVNSTNEEKGPLMEGKSLSSQKEDGYQRVKKGLLAPEEYLNDLAYSMPEVQSATDRGWLGGVHYIIDEVGNRKALRNLLLSSKQLSSNPKGLEIILNKAIRKESSQGQDPSPVIAKNYNMRVGRSYEKFSLIKVVPKVFDVPYISRDEDLQNIIRHELSHIQDHYEGIPLGNEVFELRELPQKVRKPISEIRALSHEIEYVFENNNVSNDAIERPLELIHRYLRSLHNLSPKEERLVKIQLDQLPFDYKIQDGNWVVTHENGKMLTIPDTLLGGVHSP